MATATLEELAAIIEFGEAEPLADYQHFLTPQIAAQLGTRVSRFGSAVAILTQRLEVFMLNRVVGLGVGEPASEAMVDEIVQLYRQAGIKNFGVQLSPLAQPAQLPQWLEARGLQRADNWVKCVRGPEPAPVVETDLEIVQIGPKHAATFAEITCRVFHLPELAWPWVESTIGWPGWQHYLAFDGATAVATGALVVKNGTGWLGFGATLPQYRKRGAQGAIMVRRIQDGVAQGCKWLVTETWEEQAGRPNPSYHNMLRTGFKPLYARPNYLNR